MLRRGNNQIRKLALEKRKQYGQMIQKQVLKMHRKKVGVEAKPPLPVTRYSQGSKNVKSDKAPSDSLFSVGLET